MAQGIYSSGMSTWERNKAGLPADHAGPTTIDDVKTEEIKSVSTQEVKSVTVDDTDGELPTVDSKVEKKTKKKSAKNKLKAKLTGTID